MARHARMTPEAVKDACLQHNGFETPALNSSLYLHFKGFPKVESLEPYTEAKALWLESNGAPRRDAQPPKPHRC
jgi:dynein assembly factor 1